MTSRHYYNENDPFCADWLRLLITCDQIPDGEVDQRSIEDVRPSDLDGFTSCHFFAGCGGWPAALRLAGWPDAEPIWTGSCPCQPFSNAGTRLGFADKRHLWPAWHWLIQARRPGIILGEQVASIDGLAWLDLVYNDLEGIDYAVRAIDLPAACGGAPHIRQRLWWLANAGSAGLPDTEPSAIRGAQWNDKGRATEQFSGSLDPWRELEWIRCLDGKARPTQPGIFPLALRLPGDVGRLRAFGNAITVPLAAHVIRALMDSLP